MNKLFFILSILFTLQSNAATCGDAVRLDQVNSLTVSLTSPLTDVTGSSLDDQTTRIYFYNGSFYNSMLSVGYIVFQRGVGLEFKNQMIDQQTIQPFTCNAVSIGSGQLEGTSKINFEESCPLAKMDTVRAGFDFRSSKFTLASLRYNLGSKFEVNAECN